MKKLLMCFITSFMLTALTGTLKAQTVNGTELDGNQSGIISTAVPFLLIAPDSRSGAMGDVGVSTSPDANAIAHNTAKLAFAETRSEVSLSYSPWLRGLGVKNINLAYLSGYYRLDERQTLAASFRYFSLGDIAFTDTNGDLLQLYKPSEYAVDASYIRKLSVDFSMAMAFRYIHSDLGQGIFNGNEISSGNAIAADIGMFYNKDVQLFNTKTNLAWGLSISNLGTKMQYGNTRNFLPTTLKIGGTADLVLDEKSSLAWTLEFNKLLIPNDATSSTTVPEGFFKSFSNAQLALGTGVEFWYNNLIAIRGGFYSDNPSRSNKEYFTAGAGIKYSSLELDFSYLIPTKTNNPLEKTVRFTLIYSFNNAKSGKIDTTN